MVSQKKAEEARSLLSIYGPEDAARKMGVSVESILRYMRVEHRDERHKILLIDIETAPGLGYFWNPWQANIQPDQVANNWFMLGWSAKELFDSTTMSDIVTPEEAVARDDKRVVGSLWKEVNDADIIVGHNVKKFDLPMSNTRFLVHNMPPPLPYRVVDTRDILKRNFRFEHNRLDYVNRVLSLGRKLDTGGFQLWLSCMGGDKKALAEMQKYNKNDVGILEELYVTIRAWAKSHPPAGQYVEGDGTVCPVCGGKELGYGGYYYADVNRFLAYRCLNPKCGAICRAPAGSKKKNLLRSIAR